MKSKNLILVAVLILLTSSPVNNAKPTFVSNLADQITSSSPDAFPFGIFPQKDVFVIREEEASLLANIISECPQGTAGEAKLELLPPTPDFVQVTIPCRCCIGETSQGLVAAIPGRGDVGKYDVVIRATACTGKVQIFTFRVKVKRA
jgi:hypothetical protein